MKRVLLLLLLCGVAWAKPEVAVEVLKEGRGPAIQAGHQAKVGYTLSLESGKVIDSVGAREPFEFKVGSNEVVPGFSKAVEGMKVGERRRVLIPPELGYGDRGAGPIPPGASLVFDIELYAIGGAAHDDEHDEHAHEDAHDHDAHDHDAHDHEAHDHDEHAPEVDPHAGHDHGPAGMTRSEAFQSEEYLQKRDAREITRPAMHEYLIREFYTKPWRYDDGYQKVGVSTLKVFGFLLLLLGLSWVGIRKGYVSK